jgi:hypothetical protein
MNIIRRFITPPWKRVTRYPRDTPRQPARNLDNYEPRAPRCNILVCMN